MNHQAKTGESCPHTGFYRCGENHSVAMAAGHVMPHCRQCTPTAAVNWTLHDKDHVPHQAAHKPTHS